MSWVDRVGSGRPEVRRAYSKAPWEAKVGYCRAVRIDRHVWVTGSAPVRGDGSVFGRGDPQLQARRCLDIIAEALVQLDADIGDVVRTRMFVTDIDNWEAFGRAHAAVFTQHPPATTMVEVSRLINPDMLIEIEADAFVCG